MAKKEFKVLRPITLGKTEYEIGRKKNQFNALARGEVFTADDAAMAKLIRLGAIVETKPEPVAAVVSEEAPVERTYRRTKKGD